jgi:3-hydroxyisobutyrate dehydrogenase-like beta-hydroxyacid dehydrogenase
MTKTPVPKVPNIGFIGLGRMGSSIAPNIMRGGFRLTVMAHGSREAVNQLVEAGADEVATPAAMARHCSAIVICVTGSPEVESLVHGANGILAGARPGLIVIDASTSEPSSTRTLAAALQEHGMAMVDAPVLRTPKDAEADRLISLVGASNETMESIRPVLDTYSEEVLHFGPVGAGHTAKLVNNFVTCGQAMLIAEAMAACAAGRVDLHQMYDVMSRGTANSGTLHRMMPGMLEGDLTGHEYSIANGRKDSEYFRNLTQSHHLHSTMGDAVYQGFNQATNLGHGEKLLASLFEFQEQMSDVPIVPRAEKLKAS